MRDGEGKPPDKRRASLPSPSPSVTPLPRGEALTKGKRLCKTKAPHSKAAGRIEHAPRSAERTCPATARPGCWRYKMPQAVSSDLPGTPVALCARVAAPSVCFAAACILLAAAPTATPCFRHWRRSSLLPLPRGASGEERKLSVLPRPPLDRGGGCAKGTDGEVNHISTRQWG